MAQKEIKPKYAGHKILPDFYQRGTLGTLRDELFRLATRQKLQTARGQILDLVTKTTTEWLFTNGDALFDPTKLSTTVDEILELMLTSLRGSLALHRLGNSRDLLQDIREFGWEGMQNIIADRVDDFDTLGKLLGVFIERTLSYISPNNEGRLPYGLDQEQAEFFMTEASRLVTDGPIVRKIVGKTKQGDGKYTDVMEPVWNTLVDNLEKVDKRIFGRWFATKGHDRSRVGNMIMQVAANILTADQIAKAKLSEVHQPEGVETQATRVFIANLENIEQSLLDPDHRLATMELRRFIMTTHYLLSPDAVIESALSVKGDPRIVSTGWVKEMEKVLRDTNRPLEGEREVNAGGVRKQVKKKKAPGISSTDADKTQPNLATAQIVELPLRGVYTNYDDIGAAMGVIDPDLANAAVKALCGPIADLQDASSDRVISGYQPLELPFLLLQFPRRTRVGRPLFSIPVGAEGQKTLTANEKLLSEALRGHMVALSGLIGGAHDNGRGKETNGSMTLNAAERVAYIIDLWSRILSEKKGENDRVKKAARVQFAYMAFANFLNPSDTQPAILRNAFEQALKTIGLRWPAEDVENLIIQYVQHLVNDGKSTRGRWLAMAEALGIINWDEVINPTARLAEGVTVDGLVTRGEKILTTPARGHIVAAQGAMVKRPDLFTGDKLTGNRKENVTLLREVSQLHLVWNIHELSKQLRLNKDSRVLYRLAEALKYYYTQAGETTEDGEKTLRRINEVLERQRGGKENSTQIKAKRIGSVYFFDFDLEEEQQELRDERGFEENINMLAGVGDLIWKHGQVFLDQNLRIVKRLATKEEKEEFMKILATEMETDLAWTLKNDRRTPVSMRRQIDITQQRIQNIRNHVLGSFRGIVENSNFFAGSDAIKDMLIKEVRDDAVYQEVWKQVEAQRTNLDLVIKDTTNKTIFPLEGNVMNNAEFAAKTIVNTFNQIMKQSGLTLSLTDAKALIGVLSQMPKSKELTINALSDIVRQILTFTGAAGIGYSIAHGQAAKAGFAKTVLQAAEDPTSALLKMNSKDADAYEIARKRLITGQISSFDAVFNARLELLASIEKALSGGKREQLADAINLMKTVSYRQYEQLRKAVESSLSVLDEIGSIQLDLITLDLKEAKAAHGWLKTYMDEIRPTMRDIQRMFEEYLGFQVDLANWEDIKTLFPVDPEETTTTDLSIAE